MRRGPASLIALLAAASLLGGCSGEDERPPACAACYQTGGTANGPSVGGAGATTPGGGRPATGGVGAAGAGGAGGADDGCGDSMVRLAPSEDYSFCIDVHEVTNAEYWQFMQASAPGTGPPCDVANTTYSPIGPNPSDPGVAGLPVSGVDWCDAAAYCAWADKRLCGRIGDGGRVDAGGANDPEVSEWHYACTNGGQTVYPYGNGFDADKCNARFGLQVSALTDVMSYTECHGMGPGFVEIHDMSGSVAEFTNNCVEQEGEATMRDQCVLRGGDYRVAADGDLEARCESLTDQVERSAADESFGFRCCKE